MTKFGPYELLQRLGTGATAEVHLATGPNKAGASLFALKILLPHLSERPDLRDQILREARLASSIHHPSVAEVFDVGEAEERAYLAMEYVRGRPLSALLRKLKEPGASAEPLSVSEACFIVREASLGLHEAHETLDARRRPLWLVHRDVSPQNVMVREDGRIKVVDFGLAKVTSSEEAIAFTVGGPGIKGKIPYMPPEQVRNEGLDRRADVFAACAVLFELLCGRRLYPGETEAVLIQQALTLPLPDPLQLAPALPRDLVKVMMQGLERDQQRRTTSAAALAEALLPFITDGAKGKLATRMERFFDPMPRTVEEARMVALAQRSIGQPLGAVRPITRSRPSGPDTKPQAPEEQERTTLAIAFPTQSILRTDPAGTDPSGTGPHLELRHIAPTVSQELDLPTVAEIPSLPERRPSMPDLPLIRPEVTGPISDVSRLKAEDPDPEREDPTSLVSLVVSDGPTTDVRAVDPFPTDIRPLDPALSLPEPTDPTPSRPRQADPAPTRPNPVDPSPSRPRPVDPAPLRANATDPTPSPPQIPFLPPPPRSRPTVDPDATRMNPVDPSPTNPRAAPDPAPTRPNPVDPSPTGPRSVDPAPTRANPVEPDPDDDDLDDDQEPELEPYPSRGEASITGPPPLRPPTRRPAFPDLSSFSLSKLLERLNLPPFPELTTQQTVIALAAVAALGGLGVGVMLKRLTADDDRPVRRPAAGTTPTPERPGAIATGTRPVPRQAETAKGQVVILAEPMAMVTENGRDLGTTPYVGEHLPGVHVFTLRALDGGGTAQVEVTVNANEQITRRVTLR